MRAYLDSNIFVFACVSTDTIGNECRKILDSVVKGRVSAVTTLLTFDELFYKLEKLKGFDAAVLFTENFLAMPNLMLAPVDAAVVGNAFELARKYRIAPRDAIHASTAVLHKAELLVSEDREFSKVSEIQRISARDAAAKFWVAGK